MERGQPARKSLKKADEAPALHGFAISSNAYQYRVNTRELIRKLREPGFMESVAERVNITVPRYALAAIDKLAKAQGLSPSA